jgi:hypothetical protein
LKLVDRVPAAQDHRRSKALERETFSLNLKWMHQKGLPTGDPFLFLLRRKLEASHN